MSSQRFPPEPGAVRRVRQMVRREVPFADTFDLELLASELVTNVIRHANTELVVSIEVVQDTVRIEVGDGSTLVPALRDLRMGMDGTGGAGLRLVETISEQWGADQRAEGKVVWAEIRNGRIAEHRRRGARFRGEARQAASKQPRPAPPGSCDRRSYPAG